MQFLVHCRCELRLQQPHGAVGRAAAQAAGLAVAWLYCIALASVHWGCGLLGVAALAAWQAHAEGSSELVVGTVGPRRRHDRPKISKKVRFWLTLSSRELKWWSQHWSWTSAATVPH